MAPVKPTPWLTWLLALWLVPTMLVVASAWPSQASLRGSGASAADLEATIFISTTLDSVPPAPVAVVATTVSLAPGVVTYPFTNRGIVLMRVEDAGLALARGPAVSEMPGDVGLAAAARWPVTGIDVDEMVPIPPNAWVQLRNTGAGPVRLVIIALTPERTVVSATSGPPAAAMQPGDA